MDTTAFFGREAELDALHQLRGRAAWLCGPPGVGKTRLAREHAHRRTRSGQSSLFVDLASASHADGVLGAMASALDVPPTGTRHEDRVAALGAALRVADVAVVILDNADRCAEAADQVSRLLVQHSAGIAVVVTSREHRESDEGLCAIEVAPLAGAEATRFFASRVKALGVCEEVGTAEEVARLVDLLDGIPLALELAAFRTSLLSARDLIERLEASTGVLEDPRGLEPSHRTLLRAVEASWALLAAGEQACLAGLSIFDAPFDAACAEAASPLAQPATLEALVSLRRRNLLADASPGKFALLASVREFAAQRLSEDERTPAIDRLAAHLAERAETWLRAADLHDDEAEVRALRASRSHLDLVLGDLPADARSYVTLLRARLAIARLEGTFQAEEQRFSGDDPRLLLDRARAFGEANEFERALGELQDILYAADPELSAEALALNAFTALFIDETDLAQGCIEEAASIAPRGSLAECRITLVRASIAHTFGQREEARTLYEKTLKLARRRKDHRSAARAMQNLGVFHTDGRRFDIARRLLHDAIAHHRAFGDRFREAWGYNSLGVLELRERRHQDATLALRSARDLFEAIGLRAGAASVLSNLSMIALELDTPEEARDYALDAVALSDVEEDGYVRATCNLCLAVAYWFLGRKEDAAFTFTALEQTVAQVAHIQLVVSWLGAWAALLASDGDARAEEVFRRAEAALEEVGGDPTLEQMLATNRLHLGVRRYRDEVACGARDAASTLFETLDAIREAHRHAFDSPHTSEPLRYSVRLLRVELPEAARAVHDADIAHPKALVVSRDQQAFRPRGGLWTPLGKSPSLWRLFEALVDARLQDPDAALDLEQLQQAVWPGEILTPESAANRLYVSITKLRKMGLAPHLEKSDDGYRLGGAEIVVVDEDESRDRP